MPVDADGRHPLDAMLVDERSAGAGVAETGHELLGRRSELGTGSPRRDGGRACTLPGSPPRCELVPTCGPSSCGWACPNIPCEDGSVGVGRYVAVEVGLQLPDDKGRKGDPPPAGVSLGLGSDLSSSAQLDELAPDATRPWSRSKSRRRRPISSPKPESAVGGEQDEGLPVWLDDFRQSGHVGDVEHRTLGGVLRAGPPDPARVGSGEAVIRGRHDDRVQQPVSLGATDGGAPRTSSACQVRTAVGVSFLRGSAPSACCVADHVPQPVDAA